MLGIPKDRTDDKVKSGIYEISCNECNKKYVGPAQRSIYTTYKGYMVY